MLVGACTCELQYQLRYFTALTSSDWASRSLTRLGQQDDAEIARAGRLFEGHVLIKTWSCTVAPKCSSCKVSLGWFDHRAAHRRRRSFPGANLGRPSLGNGAAKQRHAPNCAGEMSSRPQRVPLCRGLMLLIVSRSLS